MNAVSISKERLKVVVGAYYPTAASPWSTVKPQPLAAN